MKAAPWTAVLPLALALLAACHSPYLPLVPGGGGGGSGAVTWPANPVYFPGTAGGRATLWARDLIGGSVVHGLPSGTAAAGSVGYAVATVTGAPGPILAGTDSSAGWGYVWGPTAQLPVRGYDYYYTPDTVVGGLVASANGDIDVFGSFDDTVANPGNLQGPTAAAVTVFGNSAADPAPAYQDQELSTVFDIGGSYTTGSGFSWVSGVAVDTSETGYTKAVAVGAYWDGTQPRACIWWDDGGNNWTRVLLESTSTPSFATAVAADGTGRIYVVGSWETGGVQKPRYWISRWDSANSTYGGSGFDDGSGPGGLADYSQPKGSFYDVVTDGTNVYAVGTVGGLAYAWYWSGFGSSGGDDYWVPVGSAGATSGALTHARLSGGVLYAGGTNTATGQAQIFTWDFAGHPYVAGSFQAPAGAAAVWTDVGSGSIETWISHFQAAHPASGSLTLPSPTVWKY